MISPSELDFGKLIPKTLPHSCVFRQEGWYLWDPCVIRTDDGMYHLLYSRWPTAVGYDGWCTHAEIAWATAKSAAGPYEYQGVVLPQRGGGFWDGHSVYNTCIIHHGRKFYLYYTGNHGTSAWRPDRLVKVYSEEWWTHRNNQRIGVAVAERPGGPWQRFDKPLVDVGPDTGLGITGVPNLLVRPDGKFMLFFKTQVPGPGHFGGGVFVYPTMGTDPLGPFKRHPKPIVDKRVLMKIDQAFNFHIDDHFEWYQGDRYYAIGKDHDAPFMTPHGRSLLLFESPDGLDWQLSPHVLVKDFTITWDDGTQQAFLRLEMPKLLLENGRPRLLSLAAQPVLNPRESFLVIIPLLQGA